MLLLYPFRQTQVKMLQDAKLVSALVLLGFCNNELDTQFLIVCIKQASINRKC